MVGVAALTALGGFCGRLRTLIGGVGGGLRTCVGRFRGGGTAFRACAVDAAVTLRFLGVESGFASSFYLGGFFRALPAGGLDLSLAFSLGALIALVGFALAAL